MDKNTAQKSKNELVVLLHGILRSKTDMLPLSLYLRKHGYDTLNILYPSRKHSLENLTDFVDEKIRAHIKNNGYEPAKLHFVTHSMGGLIARYYITTRKPENLGSVVMLGPPNTGSEFADFLSAHKLWSKPFHALFGPASYQLATTYKHIDNDNEITYPLGVIAGNRSINPLAIGVLPKEHDGIVPVERTKIRGMRDHIIVPSNHTVMMFNRHVKEQALHFLQHQSFRH